MQGFFLQTDFCLASLSLLLFILLSGISSQSRSVKMSRKKNKCKFSIATHDILYAAGFLVLFVAIVVLPLWLFIAALRRPTPPPAIGPDGIPVNAGRITDHSRVLSPDDLDRLNAEVDAFENATRGQMAILLLASIGDNRIEELAARTFRAWGIGHAERDDGILLLLATEDRRSRIETGYGWEGALPDARVGDILREMAPYLRAGDYSGALSLGIQRIRETLLGADASAFPSPRKPPFEFASLLTWGNLIVLLLLLGIGLLVTAACLEPGSGGGSSSRGSRGGGGGSSRGSGGASRGGFGGGRSGGGGASGRW